jgi:hypothetical protein
VAVWEGDVVEEGFGSSFIHRPGWKRAGDSVLATRSFDLEMMVASRWCGLDESINQSMD